MDRGYKIALSALALAASLAACTPDTPQTQLSWRANDQLGRRDTYVAPAPRTTQAAPATRTARTYIYQGENYAIPAPKPRPAYQAPASYQPSYYDRAPVRSSVNFLWPANGRVIGTFGASTNGQRNDGINIALPMGAPIKASASGTVSYSGNELKDYGNLLLINHEGGYVTAYAHAEQLLVRRGDTVTKGQIIGYAGRTGDVSSPQLHFEIRRDTTPLNPTSLLASRNS